MNITSALLFILLGAFTAFAQDSNLEESLQRGSEIYFDFCVTCHMEQGEGVAKTFPPLAKSDYLMENREESIRGIKYGQSGELIVNGVTYNNVMTPMTSTILLNEFILPVIMISLTPV